MELACLPRCIPWNLGTMAQLRLGESGLSDGERWVREGPCSTILSKKRQGLRTKTNKWQRNSDTYVHTGSLIFPTCTSTTTLLGIGNVIRFFSMFPLFFPSALQRDPFFYLFFIFSFSLPLRDYTESTPYLLSYWISSPLWISTIPIRHTIFNYNLCRPSTPVWKIVRSLYLNPPLVS